MNLAVLYLECHNETQVRGGFGRKLTAPLITKCRDDWHARVVKRRNEADRLAVQKMAGFARDMSELRISSLPYSEERTNIVLAYIQTLPGRREQLLKKGHVGWDTGITATMVSHSYKYIDALKGILVALAGFYPNGSFGDDPNFFFSQIIASHFQWHRTYAEPYGPGTGGTIVNVICCGKVMFDVEKMVEDMAMTLAGYDTQWHGEEWLTRWHKNSE